jgi:hypothetical protein
MPFHMDNSPTRVWPRARLGTTARAIAWPRRARSRPRLASRKPVVEESRCLSQTWSARIIPCWRHLDDLPMHELGLAIRSVQIPNRGACFGLHPCPPAVWIAYPLYTFDGCTPASPRSRHTANKWSRNGPEMIQQWFGFRPDIRPLVTYIFGSVEQISPWTSILPP